MDIHNNVSMSCKYDETFVKDEPDVHEYYESSFATDTLCRIHGDSDKLPSPLIKLESVKQEVDWDAIQTPDCADNDVDCISTDTPVKTESVNCVKEELDECYLDLKEILSHPVKDFECAHCGFVSKFQGNLVRHIKYQHMGFGKIQCEVCPVQVRSRYDLRRHMFTHDGAGVRQFYCYFCSYGANKKISLARHTVKAHKQHKEGRFKQLKMCYYCSYETFSKKSFIKHLVKHQELKAERLKARSAKLLPCGLCSYSTYCRSTLITHIDGVHKKLRPFACSQCDYAANKYHDLRVHIAAKHEKQTPFQCDACPYASGYKQHLKRHIFSQHFHRDPTKKARRKYRKRT